MDIYTHEIKFYYSEWQLAEKDGDIEYALQMKKMYHKLVIESIKQPFNIYYKQLPYYKFIYLN